MSREETLSQQGMFVLSELAMPCHIFTYTLPLHVYFLCQYSTETNHQMALIL